MNKYISIYKTSFKQEGKTLGNSITSVVSFAVIIYIFKELWKFIYGGSGGGTLIHGYTLDMMIWYIFYGATLTDYLNYEFYNRTFKQRIR